MNWSRPIGVIALAVMALVGTTATQAQAAGPGNEWFGPSTPGASAATK
jgi:hypothetical protein